MVVSVAVTADVLVAAVVAPMAGMPVGRRDVVLVAAIAGGNASVR